MKRSSVFVVLLCIAVGCRREEPQRPDVEIERATPVAGKGTPRKRALLVGCTKYDRMPAHSLKGPANDVKLMRRVLTGRFSFADGDIVTLAEGAATGRPTRANIKAQFDRLAKVAGPGDQIVILLGGHGGQQPAAVAGSEPDGLDETFLPCDAGPWNSIRQAVANAIIDDELAVWTKAITDTGAALWLILDSCHSGTAIRGGGVEVARELPVDALVPTAALRKARDQAKVRKEKTHPRPTADKPRDPRLFALYACQPHEPTVERPMPPDDPTEGPHGLLTYTVCQILTQSTTPLTYSELAQRVQAQYVQWRRTSPTPLYEGPDQDHEVLGTRSWPGRSPFTLQGGKGRWKVQAGLLHGLTEQSILAVYPPPGAAEDGKLIGHVRVRKVRIAEAEVEPCPFDKMPAVAQLPVGGRCKPVRLDFGSLRLRVAIEDAGTGKTDAHKRLRQQFQELAAADDSLIELSPEGRAELLVRVKDNQAFLVAADVAQRLGPPPVGTPQFGPYALKTDRLRENLMQIARARNLLSLAAGPAGSEAIPLHIEMRRHKNGQDKDGEKLAWGRQGLVLRPGEWVGWRITQGAGVPLDVTALFVDSRCKITPVVPTRNRAGSGENRLTSKGDTITIGPFPVNDDTIGLEHLVVLAVPGVGPAVDFTCLAQDGVARSPGAEKAINSPLGRLLKHAMFGKGATRGLDIVEVDAQAMRLLSWTVLPAEARGKK